MYSYKRLRAYANLRREFSIHETKRERRKVQGKTGASFTCSSWWWCRNSRPETLRTWRRNKQKNFKKLTNKLGSGHAESELFKYLPIRDETWYCIIRVCSHVSVVMRFYIFASEKTSRDDIIAKVQTVEITQQTLKKTQKWKYLWMNRENWNYWRYQSHDE